jgi:hypothetical protein
MRGTKDKPLFSDQLKLKQKYRLADGDKQNNRRISLRALVLRR